MRQCSLKHRYRLDNLSSRAGATRGPPLLEDTNISFKGNHLIFLEKENAGAYWKNATFRTGKIYHEHAGTQSNKKDVQLAHPYSNRMKKKIVSHTLY